MAGAESWREGVVEIKRPRMGGDGVRQENRSKVTLS